MKEKLIVISVYWTQCSYLCWYFKGGLNNAKVITMHPYISCVLCWCSTFSLLF